MNRENNIIIYQDESELIRVQVLFADEDLWLTQAQLAELYFTTPQNITMHIAHIYQDAELEQNRTCKDFLQVRQEGKRQVQRNTSRPWRRPSASLRYTASERWRNWSATSTKWCVACPKTKD